VQAEEGEREMSGEEGKLNPMFLQLALSLQSAAWYQMGKTVSPISGKIERDLDQAKASIDMLVMLKEKTAGNLSDEEKKILENIVYTLQMNYVDERNKGESEAESEAPKEKSSGDGGPKASHPPRSDAGEKSPPSDVDDSNEANDSERSSGNRDS
jgi:hypothetical protein